MTAKELYEKVKKQMFEKPSSKDYDNYYMDHINTVMVQLFDENNALRKSAGKEELTEIPFVSSPEDEIPYEDKMLSYVMPKGIAAQFFIDDDLSKYSIYQTDYINARSQVMPVIIEEW